MDAREVPDFRRPFGASFSFGTHPGSFAALSLPALFRRASGAGLFLDELEAAVIHAFPRCKAPTGRRNTARRGAKRKASSQSLRSAKPPDGCYAQVDRALRRSMVAMPADAYTHRAT